jgi:predicted HicB family RNase H-like nuclease
MMESKEKQKLDIRIPVELHSKLRQEAFDRKMSINALVVEIMYVKYPKE